MATRCQKTGKVRHATLAGAAATLRRLKNVGLNPYPCSACRGWHIGNSNRPNKQQARIDQILNQHAKALAERLSRGEG